MRFAPAISAVGLAGAMFAAGQVPATSDQPAPRQPTAAAADACPMTLRMDARGRLFTGRAPGLRVSRKTLITDLHNGCKHEGPVSSVQFRADPRVPYGKVKDVIDLVQANAPAGTPIKIETGDSG